MEIKNQSFEIINFDVDIEKEIEKAARVCYKSEGKMTYISNESARALIRNLISRGHEAMLEFGGITVKFITDRGVSHEIVRHRIASYAQESTRYCNYSLKKFNSEITVIDISSHLHSDESLEEWKRAIEVCEKAYFKLIQLGETPQIARSVLPNSLKTEIVCKFNIREWRHFFKLRCNKDAHPQMRELVLPLYKSCVFSWPSLFEDLEIQTEE